MAKLDGEYFKSRKQFYIGLLLAGLGLMMFFTIGSTDVRFDLQGLQEVRGQVMEVRSYRPSSRSPWRLVVKLDTGGGMRELSHDVLGVYDRRLAAGQQIRAWATPEGEVWQIERGGQVVISVMEAGDRAFDRLLWDGGAALIPLLGGLFMVGRHLSRYHGEEPESPQEGKSA